MRYGTKATFAILSLGVLGTTYAVGASNANANLTVGAPVAAGTSSATTPATTDSSAAAPATETATPSATASASASASASAKATSKAKASSSASATSTTKKATTKATAAPAPAATKTATPTATAAPAPAANGSGSQTSDIIYYKYGMFKVTVVKSGGKISEINLITATTHGQQYEAIIPSIQAAAISANGTNFGNVSGATFTTLAFKKAVDSALAKF